jgi:hypothetical protein
MQAEAMATGCLLEGIADHWLGIVLTGDSVIVVLEPATPVDGWVNEAVAGGTREAPFEASVIGPVTLLSCLS